MSSYLQIQPSEYQTRINRLLEHLDRQRLAGMVLFDRDYILYYTGFAFIPTERPVAFVLNARGEKALFVPRLEAEHARSHAIIDRVDFYVEYPYTQHPMQLLKQALGEMGLSGNLAADEDGYPWLLGYRGPRLSELTGGVPQPIRAFIEDQMMIKSQAELALIRESIQWANLAHSLLQRYTRVGVTETEVSLKASTEATLAMLNAIGPIYRAQSAFSEGISVGYRGQIGRNAAIPHALANNITFQAGDLLVSGASAPVWGYNSEVERTMVLGSATPKQAEMFTHMQALQDLAIAALKPGIRCSEVDRQVRAYFENNHLMPYWKHHSGHAIGLRYHEGPFLDIGDDTFIQPGMVFTVEPGLYSPELGGFRHSDTVVVTEDGYEVMTYYPRDLASLRLPI